MQATHQTLSDGSSKMRTLALALCLLPAFVLADDPDPKVLAVTNTYAREMADLEKKYTAAVDRMKAVLIAEERKRRDVTIASLQALQDEATKEQSLDLAVSAKNEGEKLKSLSYMAEVKIVSNKYFKALAMTWASIAGSHGRLFFTPATADEKPIEWADKRIHFHKNGTIYLSPASPAEPVVVPRGSGAVSIKLGSAAHREVLAASLELNAARKKENEHNIIGVWRISKKGELEWLDKDKKVIGSFTFANTPVGLFGFGSVGRGRHILHIERE